MATSRVLVVGGGITGSVLSLALAHRGVDVELAEIRPRWQGAGHGITLQGNALKAFREVGVYDAVASRGVPFDMLRLRHADGTLMLEAPTPHTGGADLPSTLGSTRSMLQATLRDAVYAAGVVVRLGVTVAGFDETPGDIGVAFTDGTTARFDAVVGADGIRSHVRSLIGMACDPKPVGMGIWRVVAARPAEMDCAEVYYGGPRFKAGYSPISETACYAYILDHNLDRSLIGGQAPVEMFRERSAGYGGTWGKVRDSVPDDADIDYRWIESVDLADPWFRGRVIVIGDGAHACPPLIAQGAAMCAEDAVVLADELTRGASVETAYKSFMTRRLPRVRIVLDNSLQLAEWEIHPENPDADPARIMGETLQFLQASA